MRICKKLFSLDYAAKINNPLRDSVGTNHFINIQLKDPALLKGQMNIFLNRQNIHNDVYSDDLPNRIDCLIIAEKSRNLDDGYRYWVVIINTR